MAAGGPAGGPRPQDVAAALTDAGPLVLVADTLTADLTYYENGTIQNTWDQAAAFRGVAEGDMTRFALARKEPLRAEHEAFRDSVLAGEPVGIVTLAEGTNVVEIAEQMSADGVERRLS